MSILVRKILYWVISLTAVLGNSLVCSFFYRNSKLLRKASYVFILTLTITDLITAFILFCNPNVAFKMLPPPRGHVGGEIYCRLLWNRFLLFMCGVCSSYLCLALTLERWFSIVKPSRYSATFSARRVRLGVALSLLAALLSTIDNATFNIVYSHSLPYGKRCHWKSTSTLYRVVMGAAGLIGKALIPCVSIIVLYCHMLYKVRQHSLHAGHSVSMRAATNKITQVAALTSLAMLLCWLPSQINFALYKFGYNAPHNELSDFLVLLTFLTSSINPILYGIASVRFRKGYWEAITCVCRRGRTSTERRRRRPAPQLQLELVRNHKPCEAPDQ